MDASVVKKLLQNLQTELQLQTKLLELLTQERSEIVLLKTEELDKIRSKKEDLLLKISQNNETRDTLLIPLKAATPKGEKLKLSRVFETAHVDIQSTYKHIRTDLRKVVEAVQKLNSENGSLLKQSLGLVSSTISILTAKPTAQNNNYSRDGKMQEQNQDMPISKLGSVSSFNRSV